ncbi:hypothetical protein ACA910_008041 [Epithemia clementina (nom. ined.)]
MGAEEQREVDTQYLQHATNQMEVDQDATASKLAFHTPEFRQRVASAQEELTSKDPGELEAHALKDMEMSPEEEDVILQGQKERDNAVAEAAAVESTATGDRKKSVRVSGTVLEAAFVDPAYSWPPQEGQGKNAIELQASIDLLQGEDELSVGTTPSMRERMKVPRKPEPPVPLQVKWWQVCCLKPKTKDPDYAGQLKEYEEKKQAAKEARKAYSLLKHETKKAKEREVRQQQRYNRVPEGILIYRLDTSNRELQCLTPPHANTNTDTTFLGTMIVEQARPAINDATRRGITVVDDKGSEVTLVACEQRTAIAWLEALQLMLAKKDSKRSGVSGILSRKSKSHWNKEQLKEKELENIEEAYLNLANYSNKLIRAGALPGTKKGTGGAGGIYYSVEKKTNSDWDDGEEEALEAIAKRRAVIKDSWDFYRMICSLLRDRHKYDEVFRRMQLDSVYPYLNSMTGLNDFGVASSSADGGYENLEKEVIQPDLPEYANMTRTQVAQDLADKAQAVMPSLVEICKALAGSLGMEEVGVGPIKEVTAALRKAEKKYNGDILKVTDFCRALLVVKDFPSLLALLELARDSFGPLIRRVKMSTLKADYKAKAGGYRDCIINVELKQHICEIQVHLWPMWVVCGVDGFRHYRHCLEYNTDSFVDAYDALDGLDRKTMAELIVMAEEAVAETPLENLEWYHEKYILDYFAEAGLFMKHDLMVWAEVTFRQLIKLRTESPDIGPQHHETIILNMYLVRVLQAQNKHAEAAEIQERVQMYERARTKEVAEAEQTLWDSFMSASNDAYGMIMDPNRKEREKEEALRKEVKASKRAWRQIRAERFPFLDADADESGRIHHSTAGSVESSADEKKADESLVGGGRTTISSY